MNKVSIIGFGRFGNLLYELLQKGFEVDVFDIDSNNETESVRFVSLEDVLKNDTIFLAVPIRDFEELMKDLKLRDEMQKFQSPVRGDVIMKDLKLDPGPSVGKIKSAIENAQAALDLQPDYTFVHNPLITSRNLHLVIAKSYYFLGNLEQSLDSIRTIDESMEVEKSNLESELPKILEKLTQNLAQGMTNE